jgi:hypothetical protein
MTYLIFLNGDVVLKKRGTNLPQMLAYAQRTFGNNLRAVQVLTPQRVAA